MALPIQSMIKNKANKSQTRARNRAQSFLIKNPQWELHERFELWIIFSVKAKYPEKTREIIAVKPKRSVIGD